MNMLSSAIDGQQDVGNAEFGEVHHSGAVKL